MDKKVVLITGSNRGIGYACAKYLKEQGYVVIGNYRNDKPKLDIDTYKADVTKKTEVINMILRKCFLHYADNRLCQNNETRNIFTVK